jgi:hypothetical protein
MAALRTGRARFGNRAPAKGLWGSRGQHVAGRNDHKRMDTGLRGQGHLPEGYIIITRLLQIVDADSAQAPHKKRLAQWLTLSLPTLP